MHGENGLMYSDKKKGLMYQPQVVSIRGLLSWIEVVFFLFFLSGLSVVDVNDELPVGVLVGRQESHAKS